MTDMRAAHMDKDTSIALKQVAVPTVGPNDVLVKVAAAGLAPGMMSLLAIGAIKHLPTTLGHEAAGLVEAIGSEVDPGLVGQRVRVHPMLSCRSCDYCRTDRGADVLRVSNDRTRWVWKRTEGTQCPVS